MTFKKPLKSLTVYEREKETARLRAEEDERLKVLGQDSEIKARPWVQKDVEEVERKDREYFYLATDILKKFEKKKVQYIRVLTQIFLHFATQESIPKKYFIEVEANDIGIVVSIKDTKYYGAFKACGLPSYDFHACKNLAVKLGNTIAKLEGYFRQTNGGLALPDQEDLKVYG